MQKIFVLNGPNLNLLGKREPELYGSVSLAEINQKLVDLGKSQGFELVCRQTNSETMLIDWVHHAQECGAAYIILNAAAFAHTSVALRDALLAVSIPFIEVHITNIYARESFRRQSYLSDIAEGGIYGLGPVGYELALAAVISQLHA